MRFLSNLPTRSNRARTQATGARALWLAVAVSLVVGFVVVVMAPQQADAQNPCRGTQIFVAQVEADPWSDWDGDGISNIDELNYGTPPCALPCNYLTVTDIQLNPRGDWDRDGVDNLSEHQNGFNPCVPDQYNVVPSTARSNAPVVVTATAVPAPPPPPTPVPAPTSTPVPVQPTPLPTPTVASVPATPASGNADDNPSADSPVEASTVPLSTATPAPSPTALEGDLAVARALLEDYDRAQEEAARATPTPQPTATPDPTATSEPASTPEPAPEPTAVSEPEDDDQESVREIAADAPASRDSAGGSAGSVGDASAETSGGVTIAVDQPCTAGFSFDGQCLKLLPFMLVVFGAGAVVGSTWFFDWRKNRPEQPSLKLFD